MSLRRIANAVLLRRPAPRVAVLRLSGVIGGLGPWRSGMSLATLAPAIERAFALADGQAVALAINSPGGAPGQSALICERIRELAAEKKRPVIAFCEDVAASGGYWLACAGDEIFVNANSIVGSIGVISVTVWAVLAFESSARTYSLDTAFRHPPVSNTVSCLAKPHHVHALLLYPPDIDMG